MNNSIKPGRVLLDTSGHRVQAHGGSIFYDKNSKTYYFYGENKEYTNGENGIWTYGVRAYKSLDLYNWEDCGLIIEPDLNNEESSLNPYAAMLDRPHIIYNEKTKKYVCFCKIMRKDNSQTLFILTSDSFLGPYSIVIDRGQPIGMHAGDFDLFVSSNGKAYHLFEKVHTETIIADLNDDYLGYTGFYSSHFPHIHPPYVREATAHFMHNGRHYIITSGTTSYYPNPSEVAVSDDIHGPYTVLGNPCPNDESMTTYHSQISSVFKVPGKKNLYIALGDRWLPEFMDLPYKFSEERYNIYFSENIPNEKKNILVKELEKKYMLSDEMIQKMHKGKNTSIADYVWLPLRIIEPNREYPNGMVFIDWHDEWKIEDYE